MQTHQQQKTDVVKKRNPSDFRDQKYFRKLNMW